MRDSASEVSDGESADGASDWEDDESDSTGGEGDSGSDWDADEIHSDTAAAGPASGVVQQALISVFLGETLHPVSSSFCPDRVCYHPSCDHGICTYVKQIKARVGNKGCKIGAKWCSHGRRRTCRECKGTGVCEQDSIRANCKKLE
jgi:hypothetical protein